MANKKFYTRSKVINGVKYVAQFAGLSAALKSIDESYVSDKSSNISIDKLAKYVFDNIIVEPAGLKVDDFEDMEELNEVVAFGQEVMQGKFRNENTESTKESSGK